MRVLLLGGSGRFGEYTARCLSRSDIVSEIGLAGRNEGTLQRRASEVGNKAHCVLVDIHDERHLESLAGDYDIVVNAAGPEWEVLLPALRAAIGAGTDYCDLGGDGRTVEKLLELDSKAKERDVVAVVGIGYDPGISNLLAIHASQNFDRVHEVQICYHLALPDDMLREAVDGLLKNGRVDTSWQAVINLASGSVRLYRDGSLIAVDPMQNACDIKSPTGLTVTAFPVGNNEPITLPRYIHGVRNVSCVMGISPPELSQLFWRETSRVMRQELTVKEATRSFLNTIGSDPDRWLSATAPGWDMWLVVTGWKGARSGRYTCWPIRVGATSIPLSVAAFRILRGEVAVRGVLPPEACFEPMSFFEEVGQYAPSEDQDKPLYGESMEWFA